MPNQDDHIEEEFVINDSEESLRESQDYVLKEEFLYQK
jgi:hypothetical protein